MFVDRPAYEAAIGNPARVAGLADVFEATFRVRLIDGAGRTLVDRQAMASCGSGCWGTFDVTLPYSVGAAQWGTLRVYDRSARDGSPENVNEYRVWLTPD
ncbi:MAG TPA: Gmad2 immunoglobulin-like domain-containing protein [Candidatus Limnocylindrales bacterium]|nr:Gmad2 immunoglobulin-like domain-containing protein [Candidatus Limnocylindrales bacterium]